MKHESTIYLESLSQEHSELRLDSANSQHLLKVMRLRVGDSITLCNGRGLEAKAHLVEPGRQALLAVDLFQQQEPRPYQIDAWLPVIKASRLEFAVEKLCELGVQNICLMECDFTSNAKKAVDMKRLKRLLVSALQQSRNPWMPTLHAPRPLGKLLQEGGSKLLLADQEASTLNVEQILQSGSTRLDAQHFTICCGPEGGFSGEELVALKRSGCLPVGLGPCILRAETAILGLGSVLNACLSAEPK